MNDSVTCLACSEQLTNAKRLSDHIRMAHSMTSVEYTVRFHYDGVTPVCLAEGCQNPTRYVTIGEFKRYCADHAKLAMRAGGYKGGTGVRSLSSDTLSSSVTQFVRSLGVEVIEGARDVIDGQTYGTWVPSLRLAIDVHDLERQEGDHWIKGLPRSRYVKASSDNVRLVQFFSDEWNNRGDVCRSMLRNALGKNQLKLAARDCEVKQVTATETKPFIDANHIQGSTRASLHLVLVHKVHGVVGAATVRTPIQKKWGNVCELARMCFLQNTTVRGGASKLMSAIRPLVETKFDGILSYAELRYGEGGVYERCGFVRRDETTTNYWYSRDGRRENRFKYRAQPGKTEFQVVEEAGVRAVWGVGNRIYVMMYR